MFPDLIAGRSRRVGGIPAPPRGAPRLPRRPGRLPPPDHDGRRNDREYRSPSAPWRKERPRSGTLGRVAAVGGGSSASSRVMSLWQSVSYAFRSLRRAPVFSAAVVLTLTIGIGSAAAIFAVVNAVLLRPLPYGHPEQLVGAWFDLPPVSTDARAADVGHVPHVQEIREDDRRHRALRRGIGERQRPRRSCAA